MTRRRSAVKPTRASPRVAAAAGAGSSSRHKRAERSLRITSGARERMRHLRGTLDGDRIVIARRAATTQSPTTISGRRAMTGRIDGRLKELRIELPQTAAPVANYVPYAVSGNLVFVSGQISVWNGGKPRGIGKLGASISIADGQAAARLCALNILAQVRAACGGDLDRVRRVVRLGGYVNCTPDFTEMPQVVNGASDLMVEVFGDNGRHARMAVGVSSL